MVGFEYSLVFNAEDEVERVRSEQGVLDGNPSSAPALSHAV